MQTRFILALVLVLSEIPGGQAWGQLFRFVPVRLPVPGRLPIRPPVHLPIHPPTSVPQNTDPSQPNQPSGHPADPRDLSIIILVCFGIGLFALLACVLVAVKEVNPSIGLMSPLIGLFGLLGGVFALMKKLRPSGGLIRIISTPPGEASHSIRQAWVGLELPLAKSKDQGQNVAAMEVLSWKQECTTGYAVEGRAALERLAAHAPEAAAWWRENVPYVLDSGYQFIFPVENCQKLD